MDTPGTKPTNSYVNVYNTDALSKNLQHGCNAEPETCTELAQKLQEHTKKFQYNLQNGGSWITYYLLRVR
jgi:hypothetical protein